MSRISLFEFKVDMSIREIANCLLEMRYAQNRKSGFMLGRVGHDTISVKHVTEVVTERTITNPFGETEVSHVLDYLVNQIEIRQGLIKVSNPTKSLFQFKQDLSESLGYLCSITPLSIDLKKIAEDISKSDTGISVTAVDIVSRNLMLDSTVKMSIASNQCVLKKVSNHFDSKSFDIRKLKVEVHGVGRIELSCKGGIKLDGGYDDNKLYRIISEQFISPLSVM
ncbi:hypothetical protein OA7_0010440 [Vibrio cyclitrophicus 1F53]|uniref:hypothetical protein n=1 Tax=Vibrio cyclitrophicus TaxID=47951 RepID=UPI0002FFBE27|nr:hypothetical protein [Vibrio cyclitrophicus]OEF34696.1 hypothetical protein OA7_10105 [Vibrio cyclitrophicus 1F53]OEF67278.1 hypothetical protein OAA_06245 [Vibrio cyclitrophicus 1F175]PMH24625.1 hypothetical protein BCU72_06900 [Vibrio cyclitrophicus]PMH80203.1 hypothetical protein BCU60_18050 [Vibrio cyclitrophicus]